jgi:hypothetical protein
MAQHKFTTEKVPTKVTVTEAFDHSRRIYVESGDPVEAAEALKRMLADVQVEEDPGTGTGKE